MRRNSDTDSAYLVEQRGVGAGGGLQMGAQVATADEVHALAAPLYGAVCVDLALLHPAQYHLQRGEQRSISIKHTISTAGS